jgi:hypothetical protein
MDPQKIVDWGISGLMASIILMVVAVVCMAVWGLAHAFGWAGMLVPIAVVAVTPWVKRHIYDA